MTDTIHPITQLVHSTVRIQCIDSNSRESSGTGYIYFFCEENGISFPCVVTNKHVVRGATRGVFNLTLRNEDGSPKLGSHEAVTLENPERYCIQHPTPSVDLVALPIGSILNNATKEGRNYYFTPLGKNLIATDALLTDLSPMEEIVMIGYPNGLWDEVHNLPIIRKGVTATHPRLKLNGKPEFLIDAACFPGSSGSPVFLVNLGSYLSPDGGLIVGSSRIALLGTLYAGPQHATTGEIVVVEVPTDTKSLALGTIPNNLGYVIQATELLALEDAVCIALKPRALTSRNSKCPCGSGRRFKECCGRLH